MRFGAREYDAGLGRWLARDPIGFAGGWNQYGYVANNPVGHADPSGLANYEHPMQWLPPDADIRAGSLLAEQEIADALTNMALTLMLWEIGGAFWARPYFQAGAACSGASKGVAANRLAGQAGESFLARTFGSRSQVTMQTSQGRRVIDNFTEGIARESKVGRTSLTSTVRGLMAKDAELLGSGRVEGVAWHFFPGQTGVGPTAPLQSALEKAEIGIVIH